MKGKVSTGPSRSALGSVWDAVVRHRAWVWRGGAAAGIAFIVLLVHRSAYNLLEARPEYRLPAGSPVSVAPNWGTGETSVELPADLNLLDDSLVARLGRTFEANPWVRRVNAIERVFPNRLRVRFELRRPHVAVRAPEGVYLLDEAGVLLPGVYRAGTAAARPFEIVGVTSPRPPAGQRWIAPDVRAGLELVELAAATPALHALGVRAVDVSNSGGRVDRRRAETALITAQGCVIYWGRAPSAQRFGEAAPAQKLELLTAVLKEYPKLDGLKYVKLHGGKAVVSPAETRVGRRPNR